MEEEVDTPMKKHSTLVGRCADVLRRETALLDLLAAVQDTVRKAVFAREWTDLDALLAKLESYGADFEALEAERARLFGEFGGQEREPVGFYTLVSRLGPEDRRELTELYRKLKLDTLKVRLANDALSSYLRDARATLTDVLDAAYPDRRGRLYSRRGAPVHPEMSSIVLNHAL